MKNYSKIAYIALIVIIITCGFFIYKVFAKSQEDGDIKSKALSEVKFIESKFLSLFNDMNNIEFENYKLSVTESKEDSKNSENSEQSGESSSGGEKNSKGSQSSEGESEKETESSGDSSSSSGSSSSGQSPSSSEKNKQYNLEEIGVLTSNEDIDWKKVKNEVESVYTSLYTMTLDLYQTSTNQQDIVNFNKEYDNLVKAVKEENKENTLKELSILNDYIPKFIENCSNDEKEIIVTKTKNEIFKAYSILDKEDWNTISNNINNAIQEFTKLVTNINNKETGNQYSINKTYVMLNEIQNAVQLKDKEVFLIKYKNLLEELQNM